MDRPDNPAPLTGLRVLVTRSGHQAKALSDILRSNGAKPIELPVIEIVPLPLEPLDASLAREFDWIVLTSSNTVRIAGELLLRGRGSAQIAVVGSATAKAARTAGLPVDLIPESFVAEAVLEALTHKGVDRKTILIPGAKVSRDVLPEGLRAAGAIVTVVPVYRTDLPELPNHDVLDCVRAGQVDVLTFASPSSVTNLMQMLGGSLPAGPLIACVGPVTAQRVQEYGYTVDVLATNHTSSGLVSALIEHQRGKQ